MSGPSSSQRVDSREGELAPAILARSLTDAAAAFKALPTPIPDATVDLALNVFMSIEVTVDMKDFVPFTQAISLSLQQISVSLRDLPPDKDASNTPPEVRDGVRGLIAELGAISQKSQKTPRLGLARFLGREADVSDLERITMEMRDAVLRFQVWYLKRRDQDVQKSDRDIDPRVRSERLLGLLRPVIQASYDASSIDRATCFPGTRVGVLDEIETWYNDTSLDSPGVLSLIGLAGTGKTTIAMEIATRAAASGALGASFFFSVRSASSELRDAMKVLPTLTYQLCRANPDFKNAILQVLDEHPDIASQTLNRQAEGLIQTALSAFHQSTTPLLVILDAFDECKGQGAEALPRLLLRSFTDQQGVRSLPIKLLITSRPEPHILNHLRSIPSSRQIVLHQVERNVVQQDIKRYLETTLRRIPEDLGLFEPENWYRPQELDMLVRNSGGLFVYAAMVIRYISSDPPADPRQQLSRILSQTRSLSYSGAFSDLDGLYMEVLQKISTAEPEFIARCQTLLSSLIFMRDQLSLRAMEELLALRSGEARSLLRTLSSVLVFPSDDGGTIKIFHPSFAEFLLDPARCSDSRLRIDSEVQDGYLAMRCLTIMLNGPLTTSLNSLSLQATPQDIPPVQKYCALHWASHLTHSRPGHQELVQMLDRFAKTRVLRWLEILSTLKAIRTGAKCLQEVFDWAKRSGCSDSLTSILHDTHRLTLTFANTLERGPIHLYNSALAWCPRTTSLWKAYNKEPLLTIHVLQGFLPGWSSAITMLDGHTDKITGLSFSPDGSTFVSGSGDATLRIWDATTGACIATLEGHSDDITGVAFSPNGSIIASNSRDGTIRMWSAFTGVCNATMDGHTDNIACVTFSPDGSTLVSGSDDQTLRLWDVFSATCIATLEGHTDAITNTVFSPDGSKLVSASRDRTMRIWGTVTGACIVILDGHTGYIRCIAFSPDGSRIVSGSDDRTIRMWDVISGTSIATLEGHDGDITSIVFSPDGSRVVSGSNDHTLRMWDTLSTACMATLKGHADGITSVVFSPDGSRLVSSSRDRTIRIWDAITGGCIATLEGHADGVTAIALSPDGLRLVSGSSDGRMWIWDANAHEDVVTLQDHPDSITSVAFSLDGSRVASGSAAGTIRIWDTKSGTCITVLEGGTGEIAEIKFSSDGTQVESQGSTWDITTGKHFLTSSVHLDPETIPTTSSKLTEPQYRRFSGASVSDSLLSVSFGRTSSIPVCAIPISNHPTTLPQFYDSLVTFGNSNGKLCILDLVDWRPPSNREGDDPDPPTSFIKVEGQQSSSPPAEGSTRRGGTALKSTEQNGSDLALSHMSAPELPRSTSSPQSPPSAGKPAKVPPNETNSLPLQGTDWTNWLGGAIADLTLLININQTVKFIGGLNGNKVQRAYCDGKGEVVLKRPLADPKAYSAESLKSIRNEIHNWTTLKHPHIVAFLGTCIFENHLHLVSSYIMNGRLLEYVKVRPDLDRMKVLIETADALHYLHSQRIIHRDVKADNILIGESGEVKLCGFHLSELADFQAPLELKRWWAPELFEEEPRSFSSDVYAFGITISEVLKGALPFLDVGLDILMSTILTGGRPDLHPTHSKAPPRQSYEVAWGVARRCWVMEPTQRISIREALDLLKLKGVIVPEGNGDENEDQPTPRGWLGDTDAQSPSPGLANVPSRPCTPTGIQGYWSPAQSSARSSRLDMTVPVNLQSSDDSMNVPMHSDPQQTFGPAPSAPPVPPNNPMHGGIDVPKPTRKGLLYRAFCGLF